MYTRSAGHQNAAAKLAVYLLAWSPPDYELLKETLSGLWLWIRIANIAIGCDKWVL